MHGPTLKHFRSGNFSGAEFSAVGAEFSAELGPSSPWNGGRVLHGADFSAGPTSPWGRVWAWAEFSAGPSSPVFVCTGGPTRIYVATYSGQTILLNDRSDRSKLLRSIIDRKANLRSIICSSFIIEKWIGLLLWKQYIVITVRLGIWDNSHLL